MNEIIYGNKLLQLLSENNTLANYFKVQRLDLEERMERWKDETIRIGLVGVTSSGKSTLLNALLGEPILPTAVRPSSGSIIICSKGNMTNAQIVFEDGKTIKVAEKDVAKALKKYGDEANNVENKFKVKEIHLQSKNFLLPNNIQIIDSPGLDAFGLERHEELTLSTLLPTIDLCLYVVTLKTNSDATTHRILHQINEQHKPMIIVQNMLDSVVPKIGVNGIVEKSREEVAKEHFNRTKRILDAIDSSLHEIVQIVQLSAKRAIDARQQKDKQKFKESQLELLLNMIQSYEQKIGPQLFRTRGRSLVHLMNNLVEEESKLSGDKETFEKEIERIQKDLEKQIAAMDNAFYELNKMKAELNKILNTYNNELTKCKTKISRLTNSDLIGAREILSSVKNSAREIEDKFISEMKKKHSDVSKLMNEFGADLGELLRSLVTSTNSQQSQQFLKVQSRSETIERQEKQRGLVGGAKRLFGSLVNKDWGYITVYDEIEVVDKQVIQQNLTQYGTVFNKTLQQKIDEWSNQLESAIRKLVEMQEKQKKALDEKVAARDQLTSLEQTIYKVQSLLVEIQKDLTKNEKTIQQYAKKIKNEKVIVYSGKMVQMEVTKISYQMYMMSHQMVRMFYKKCIERVEQLNKGEISFKQTIVLGWDEDSLIHFVQRYFSLQITEQQQKSLYTNGLLKIGQIYIVYENKLAKERGTVLNWLVSSTTNAYILADVSQVGQAKSQISKSEIVRQLKQQKSVCNLVMQSFTEFLESGAYEEAVEMFNDVKRMDVFKEGQRLINDVSPLFSLIHLQLDDSKTIVHDAAEMTHYIQSNMSYLISSGHIARAYQQYLHALTKRIGVK
ncbi:dynamin family protein [Lysinibacillus sp. KU-BSD001]|uniref:dynamin family protein n=1 Tax=Lysinibacillus sp. KU-BSD001 TaxID=3141328 RepID=UPI0036F0D697